MAAPVQRIPLLPGRRRTSFRFRALELLRYMGPGLLVTVGFIDPGNWASNLAAGGEFGYALLWMVTFSTIMLIVLQHNAAHLGITTGLCLSEAASIYLPPAASRLLLGSAVAASVSTSLAEIIGGAIALQMLLGIPVKTGACIVVVFVTVMLFTNSYRLIEKWIIAFVSIIGLSFIYELTLAPIDWPAAARAWVLPSFPDGSMVVIMSVLGAVVMPHNLFLHSEVIQSRNWKPDKKMRHKLHYEYIDTVFSMFIGWAINSAMILLAASALFTGGIPVKELQQADSMLRPLLGNGAAVIFAIALLFAGIASTITSGMAGGSIFSGIYRKPYNIKDPHTKAGICISLVAAYIIIIVIGNPFEGLIYSQVVLSIQLPFTIFLQVRLTSSQKVMGRHKNSKAVRMLLYFFGVSVTVLNILMLISFIM